MKRHNEDMYSKDDTHEKKTKLNPASSTTINLLNALPKDEFSHMISFLKIGEVIMLSLSCKSIHNLIGEHLQILYPYFVPQINKKKNIDNNNENKNIDSLEWSIGRALHTNRKLIISNGKEVLEKVEKIFDCLIERKEPFEKLTRIVQVNGEKLGFDEVFKLFSKSTGQPRENVKFVTLSHESHEEDDEYDEDGPSSEVNRKEAAISVSDLNSVPIGFLFKDLIIDDMSISLSHCYSILSQCHALEKLKLAIDDRPQVEFEIQVPMMENLKYLEVRTVYGILEEKLIYDLVKLAPNLEYLDIVYSEIPPSDDFLMYLTEKCPNLKGISIDIEDDTRELSFSDQLIEQFLKRVPKLEYLNFGQYCMNVSGEIFTKIGQFSNLRSVNINRGEYAADLVPQYNDLHFGGGILNNLEYISLGHTVSLEDATQSEKDKFITSLVEVAPNIKDIGSISTMEGINLFNYMDKLAPLLRKIPRLSETSQLDEVKLWLKKAKKLEEVVWEYNVDLSDLEPILSVKKLTIERNVKLKGNFDQFSRVFPSITKLNLEDDFDHDEFIQVFKQGSKWPDLKLFNRFSSLEEPKRQELFAIRPNIWGKDIPDEKIQFVYEWLILDEDFGRNEKHMSKMRKFVNNH